MYLQFRSYLITLTTRFDAMYKYEHWFLVKKF